MQVNNGTYRKSTFTIRRFMFNREIFSGGFPVIERITDAFGEMPSLTIQQFALLSEAEYLNRLNLFYQYLEFKYPFFKKVDWPGLEGVNSPSGQDLNQCPLNYQVQDAIYANLRLQLVDGVTNKEASLHLDLMNFNGTAVNAPFSFGVKILLKNVLDEGFVDWTNVEGNIIDVPVTAGQNTVQILAPFRYKGVNDGTMEFKNIHATLFEVEENSGIEIGNTNTVFTMGYTPFYLVNLISNISSSYQDFPNQESLDGVVQNGQGLVAGGMDSYTFEFHANQKSRPVFIYPATYPDLKSIDYVNDGGMNILDSGAFDLNNGLPKIAVIGGANFKVYASKNMVVFPHRAKYEYKF